MSFFDKYRSKNIISKVPKTYELTESSQPSNFPLCDQGPNKGGSLWNAAASVPGRVLSSGFEHFKEESQLKAENQTSKIEENTSIMATPLPKTKLGENYKCKTDETNYDNCLRENPEKIENCENYFKTLKACHETYPSIKETLP